VTTTSFRVYLQSEFTTRRARNPRYSLRAFAKGLNVDHSSLSQWMRGARPISARTIDALGRRLKLNSKQVRLFIEHRGAASPDLAILDLIRRADFKPDSRWIAGELRLDTDAVNVAIQRLLRLELLRMPSPHQWIDMRGDS